MCAGCLHLYSNPSLYSTNMCGSPIISVCVGSGVEHDKRQKFSSDVSTGKSFLFQTHSWRFLTVQDVLKANRLVTTSECVQR